MAESTEVVQDPQGAQGRLFSDTQLYAVLMNKFIKQKDKGSLHKLLMDLELRRVDIQDIVRTGVSRKKEPPLKTAITSACGNEELLALMVRHGIDLKVKLGERELTVLHIATIAEDKNILQYLLEMPNVKTMIDETDIQKKTPLHYAVEGGSESLSIVKILLKNNAKVDEKDEDGNAPIHLAAVTNLEPMKKLQALCKKAYVNIQDAKGSTALHLLLTTPSLSLVEERLKVLLKSGINTQLKNREDHTAMECCLVREDIPPALKSKIVNIYNKHIRENGLPIPPIVLPYDTRRTSLNVSDSPSNASLRRKSSGVNNLIGSFIRRFSTFTKPRAPPTDISGDNGDETWAEVVSEDPVSDENSNVISTMTSDHSEEENAIGHLTCHSVESQKSTLFAADNQTVCEDQMNVLQAFEFLYAYEEDNEGDDDIFCELGNTEQEVMELELERQSPDGEETPCSKMERKPQSPDGEETPCSKMDCREHDTKSKID